MMDLLVSVLFFPAWKENVIKYPGDSIEVYGSFTHALLWSVLFSTSVTSPLE